MKHNKQRGSSGALGFCLISIYFFIGLIFYFALFFMRIGSNPSWIELFFLIYGLFGLIFIMPYIIGMLGRILVFKCQDDGCEYSYCDDDEDEADEKPRHQNRKQKLP